MVSSMALLVALAGCGPPGDGAVACGSLEPRTDDEIALCNDLDQAVIARVATPAGEAPAQGWPGVVLLHGSGGLFFTGEGGECSETLQDQFQIWADLLTERGYAVIMPSSFYSRGFCEWGMRSRVPRELDDRERLVVRTFDAAAAAQWLCDEPSVDCDRLAVMGFSNGASTTLMLIHEELQDADDPRLHELEVPAITGAVAYYPGCGLDGLLATSLDAEDYPRYYYPSAPVWVPHAEKDKLLDKCEELRDPQVDAVADDRGVGQDMFELEVYAGAHHGFDVWFSGDPQADLDARTDAQAQTLALLEQWLAP